MSASNNLSKPLFHGTQADLKVGDVVVPDASGHGNYAWATKHPRYAEHFAKITRGNNPNPQMFGSIYTVEPVDAKESKKLSRAVGGTDLRKQPVRVSKKGFKVTGLHKIVDYK